MIAFCFDRYYWKVLYNPDDSTGVALISLNNPHISSAEIDNFKVCTELQGNYFLNEVDNPNEIYRGIVYACEVSDAAAAFEEIPDLGTLGILG